ncbi:MAG: hypothetical protein WBO68_14375, partial [Pyrinomonadaceae bacterium]
GRHFPVFQGQTEIYEPMIIIIIGTVNLIILVVMVGERQNALMAPILSAEWPATVLIRPKWIVAGGLFFVADPVFYCRKPPKTLSLTPLKTVAERVFSTFSSILLIKLWYVPQFEREVKNTRLVFPKNAQIPQETISMSRLFRILGTDRH